MGGMFAKALHRLVDSKRDMRVLMVGL
eukprot:COSAG06_NODE_20143_length_806_cov_3.702970_1_plen_26_part_10